MQLSVDLAGLHVIAHLYLEDVDDFLFDLRHQYREGRFDTAVQITAHPVGRRQVKVFLAVIIEVPDAGMLQKHIHNTGNP